MTSTPTTIQLDDALQAVRVAMEMELKQAQNEASTTRRHYLHEKAERDALSEKLAEAEKERDDAMKRVSDISRAYHALERSAILARRRKENDHD